MNIHMIKNIEYSLDIRDYEPRYFTILTFQVWLDKLINDNKITFAVIIAGGAIFNYLFNTLELTSNIDGQYYYRHIPIYFERKPNIFHIIRDDLILKIDIENIEEFEMGESYFFKEKKF